MTQLESVIWMCLLFPQVLDTTLLQWVSRPKITVIEECLLVGRDLDEKAKILNKFHKRFAHPTPDRLGGLLRDADVVDKDCDTILNQIAEKCEVCHKLRKTPARPVVALPMATRFNEVVFLDLKKWNEKWILYFIDAATLFHSRNIHSQQASAPLLLLTKS